MNKTVVINQARRLSIVKPQDIRVVPVSIHIIGSIDSELPDNITSELKVKENKVAASNVEITNKLVPCLPIILPKIPTHVEVIKGKDNIDNNIPELRV